MIDLSPENVARTKMQNEKLVKDINYKYNQIEYLFTKDNTAQYFRIGGLMEKKKFIKKYGNYKVLSTHNYDDTRSTSVLLIDKHE